MIDMTETDEQSLEQYLQRSGPLSRAYREMGDESPSTLIDEAVISGARAAIAEHRHGRTPQWRWAGLSALAATVLLSFALMMRIALEPQSTPAVATIDKQRSDSEPMTATPDQERTYLSAPARTELSQPKALVPAPATPALSAPADHAPAAAPTLEEKSTKKEAGIRAGNALDEASARVSRQSAVSTRHEPATAEKEAEPTSALDAGQPSERAAAPAMSPATVPGAYATTGPAMSPSAQGLQKAGVKSPEEWLDEIARLRANGQEDAAEREYAEFRKAYPDYVPGRATTPTR